MGLLAELKRRNVIRMAGLYLVGAWLLVQVAGTVLPIFHTPDWALQALVALMAMAEFTRGNEAASRQLLAKMEQDFAVGFAYQIAQVHAWRGEQDQAFAWLERCFPLHDAGLVRLPFDPVLDPLRKDPRLAALVTKMGFPK